MPLLVNWENEAFPMNRPCGPSSEVCIGEKDYTEPAVKCRMMPQPEQILSEDVVRTTRGHTVIHACVTSTRSLRIPVVVDQPPPISPLVSTTRNSPFI